MMGSNQRQEKKSLVSYQLTVINYQLEETTDFMSVVFQFLPNGQPLILPKL